MMNQHIEGALERGIQRFQLSFDNVLSQKHQPHRVLEVNPSLVNTTGGCSGKILPPSTINWLEQYVSPILRFKSTMDQNEITYQMENRAKFLLRLNFPRFEPTSENDFEDWADQAARSATTHLACLAAIVDAWKSVSSERSARVISRHETTANNIEDLIDKVAQSMFPNSSLVDDLEMELINGKRATSIPDLEDWLFLKGARYIRLCARRAWDSPIGNSRICESIRRSLPPHLELKVREDPAAVDLDSIFKSANRAAALVRDRGSSPSPKTNAEAYPAKPSKNPLLADPSLITMQDVRTTPGRQSLRCLPRVWNEGRALL